MNYRIYDTKKRAYVRQVVFDSEEGATERLKLWPCRSPKDWPASFPFAQAAAILQMLGPYDHVLVPDGFEKPELPIESERYRSICATEQRNKLTALMETSWAAGAGDTWFVRIQDRDYGPISAHPKGGFTRPYDDERWASPLDAACEIDAVWLTLNHE